MPKPSLDYLREEDIRVLVNFMSPDYLLPAARALGNGDVIVGAIPAYEEARRCVRQYAAFVRWRESRKGHDLRLAQALRAMGLISSYSPVDFIPLKDFRLVAKEAWHSASEADIPGAALISVGNSSKATINRASIKAISQLLQEYPRFNRSFLDGRIWGRRDSKVLLNMEIGPDKVRSVVFDPANLTDLEIDSFLFRSLRRLLRVERHPLRFISDQLLAAWARNGFIVSAAGAMVSCANTPMGWATFFPSNGVPLVFQVNAPIDGKIWLGVRIDHRVMDGGAAEEIYKFLEERIPRLLSL